MMKRAPRTGKSAVTIRTVAQRAGVSAMTVSKVLNGQGAITQATREAVLRAVEELNYTPNVAARQLATASILTIGMLHGELEESFLSRVMVGATRAAARTGAQIVMARVDAVDAGSMLEAVFRLQEGGARGILLPGPFAAQIARHPEFERIELPLIAIAPGVEVTGMPSMLVDEASAARAMTTLLIERGYERIGFLDAPSTAVVWDARRLGHLAALREHGRSWEVVVPGAMTVPENVEAAGRLLDQQPPPDAIFAWNDELAACALIAAHRRGLDVPKDVAIAGFDDSSIAVKVWPALSSIRPPIAEMAEQSLERLVSIIRGELAATPTATYFDYVLIERDSTGRN
jgi:LacI family transcriptional regulator